MRAWRKLVLDLKGLLYMVNQFKVKNESDV